MILQVDIVGATSIRSHGFYRLMFYEPRADLPSYWMFNGDWHLRRPPDLNPPSSWRL